ncbi:MAG TPA: hypothetical protein PLJ60_01005 [Chryseolinea sp.]|mgnify:CR=1 FL=1|nr:hypothetical protein [Chryseolinea sp.]HPM28887.1 hypothetical protein [Chryseolinea sp.]
MRFFNSIFNLLRINKKNWKAVVLCLFTAMVFWFFNALNKNYTTNISFPLAFEYNQIAYIPIRPLPTEVRINVTGIGWNLFRRSTGLKVPPLVIPMEHPSQIKKIVGSTLPTFFANQLEGLQINFILTDTLHIAIEHKFQRWIKLRLDSPSILFKKGYGMSSKANVLPDSIFIEGPISLLNALPKQVSLKLSQRNIDKDFAEDVEVKFLNEELIDRNPPTVMVRFNVDKLIEVVDSVDLKIINAPTSSHPSFQGKQWPCVFAIPERQMKEFKADSVYAVVDLKGFKRGEIKVLPVLHGLPPFTQIVKTDSVSVKF